MKPIFAWHAIPRTARTDNGPQFSPPGLAKFAQIYGFQHRTSCLRFSQSSGAAERALRTINVVLINANDPYHVLFERRMMTWLPSDQEGECPQPSAPTGVVEKNRIYKRTQVQTFNRRHAARELPPLRRGGRVGLQSEQCPVTVISLGQRPCFCVVEADHSRAILKHNRRGLVAFSPPPRPAEEATKGEPASLVVLRPNVRSYPSRSPAASSSPYRTRSGRLSSMRSVWICNGDYVYSEIFL